MPQAAGRRKVVPGEAPRQPGQVVTHQQRPAVGRERVRPSGLVAAPGHGALQMADEGLAHGPRPMAGAAAGVLSAAP